MKKIFRGILVGIVLGISLNLASPLVFADNIEPPKSEELFQKNSSKNLAKTSGIHDYTEGSENSGEFQFREGVMVLLKFFKKILIPIAILLVVYAGIELYLTHGDEEKYKKSVSQVLGIGAGFLLMAVAVNVVDFIVFGKSGEIFREDSGSVEFAKRGMSEIIGMFDYFTVFAVIIAVGYIIFNAISLIVAGGEDESQISNIKKKIIYSVVGIIILVSAKPMLQTILDSDGHLQIPSISLGISLVAKWINFVLGLIGTFAVISLIYAGVRLIMHFGDEEATTQAKKIITAALIGIVITFSAWTIVNYFLAP